ncbi:hypothetical protein GWI33_005929 [Rhynchophorus ferrugineus]|uniref:Uncharacterized protein n=1 Tax=Rhynchophorus ferrugineus TaxID=354439 RepID=A0A834MLY9_RHYFE|nr:hypothetical protein GWI33_005929 [Rhynchophorus ferrugineus]
MMLLYALPAVILCLSLGNSLSIDYDEPTVNFEKLEIDIQHWSDIADLENLQNAVRSQNGSLDIEINEIVDVILDNLRSIIIKSGLDPYELEDRVINLKPSGSLNLTDGYFKDLSSINRYDDVVISYAPTRQSFSIELPLSFDQLLFNYKYQAKFLLLTYTGNVQGIISDIKIGMEFSYNTCDNRILINKFRLRDSGKFSLIFTGSGILDWILNAFTSAVTTILHPALIRIVELFVNTIAQQVVNVINSFLNS